VRVDINKAPKDGECQACPRRSLCTQQFTHSAMRFIHTVVGIGCCTKNCGTSGGGAHCERNAVFNNLVAKRLR